jgi:hypothetical protein
MDADGQERSSQIEGAIDAYEAFQSGLPLDQQTRDLTGPEMLFIRRCAKYAAFEDEPLEKAFELANWNLRQIRQAATERGMSGKWADGLMTRMNRMDDSARFKIIPTLTEDRMANLGYGLNYTLHTVANEVANIMRGKALDAVVARYEAFQQSLPAEQRATNPNQAEKGFIQQCEQQAEALGEKAETGFTVANWNLARIHEMARTLTMGFGTRDELIQNPSLLPDITTTKISPAPEHPGYDLYLRIMELGSQLMQN